ncbi:tetratricopeptide repeat protein [Pseudaeromonas paramecii]|uniref:Tetratricopeptide repeat protein n=1 Tax=Pseudaeromonas paramecii TaxID=2138166 RepID=A0ABP8Q3I5_9GAMM
MTLSDTHFTDNELFHLAIAAARQQQHEDTQRHLKTLLARNPEHAEAHYLLGTAYVSLGMMPRRSSVSFSYKAPVKSTTIGCQMGDSSPFQTAA